MADINYNDHAAKAAPTVDDFIPIWDVAATQSKKATINNILNARLTGNGVIATGGFTLTIPATGTAALLGAANTFTGANTFTQSVTGGRFRSNFFTIADDGVEIVVPPLTTGLLAINSLSAGSNRADVQTLVAFRCTTGLSVFTRIIGQPSTAVQVTTGALTGTTGNDGFFTVSANAANNSLYLENRTDAGIQVSIVFLC